MTSGVSLQGEFSNRRILVVGASGSIGRMATLKLAEAGAKVVISGRDKSKLEIVADSLPPNSCQIEPYDLVGNDDIAGWLRKLVERDGPFSGIVHAAGMQKNMPLRSINTAFIDEIFHANVTTAIMLGKAFRQRGCHAEDASLVLIGSIACRIGGAGNVAYSASKGAILAATTAMAHELLRDKIRVNCVVPGLIESDMAEKSKKITPPESWSALLAAYPLGLGNAEDIAYGILYLLSNRSRWMTGTELKIDGGLSIV